MIQPVIHLTDVYLCSLIFSQGKIHPAPLSPNWYQGFTLSGFLVLEFFPINRDFASLKERMLIQLHLSRFTYQAFIKRGSPLT